MLSNSTTAIGRVALRGNERRGTMRPFSGEAGVACLGWPRGQILRFLTLEDASDDERGGELEICRAEVRRWGWDCSGIELCKALARLDVEVFIQVLRWSLRVKHDRYTAKRLGQCRTGPTESTCRNSSQSDIRTFRPRGDPCTPASSKKSMIAQGNRLWPVL
jgi:hypothetical protein